MSSEWPPPTTVCLRSNLSSAMHWPRSLGLDTIDVLFYRRDSEGEGGSGLFVLGDVFLRPLLKRFAPKGGLIVTDGSNSRGSNFERMVRSTGLVKHGWRFSASPYQPFRPQHGLWRLSVLPVVNDEA